MRQLTITLLLIHSALTLHAQAPQGISYQAVIRDSNGQVVTGQAVGIRYSILDANTTIYQETHVSTTDNYGLLTLIVGQGTPTIGSFTNIPWSNGTFFGQLEADITGGTNYVLFGSQQLMSVPYALYAENSGNGGVPGPTGPTGADGAPGVQGQTGATGPTGPAGSGSSNAWSLTGNAGTDAQTNYIGTSDARNLIIKVNGQLSGRIEFGTFRSVSFGYQALNSNSTGAYNTATGYQALYSNTSGIHNTAAGYRSLYSNSEGQYNTAIGYRALYTNSEGYYNTATGYDALFNNASGTYNTANGVFSLFYNTTGSGNSAGGYSSLYHNTTGYQNTATGNEALYRNTEGASNTATGSFALNNNLTGNDNTATGSFSLYRNTTGSANTASGLYSLSYITTQTDNAAFGFGAGDVYAFMNGTFVGSGAYPNANFYSNITGLGYQARPIASNSVRIGNSSVTSIGGYAGWTNLSDERFKTNVREDVHGLDFIMNLRPVVYNLDAWKLADRLQEDQKRSADGKMVFTRPDENTTDARNQKASITYTGFLAQEVEQAAQKIGYEFSGVDAPEDENGIYGLRYAEFVVPLVKAVQEQQHMLEQQKREFQKQMDRLKELVELQQSEIEVLKCR
jgi:trimeric autotransporter adhesin